MSVIVQEFVQGRRYSGYRDPRYPLGTWFAAGTVTGDGTGGTASVDLVFSPATAPTLNSNLYSIEQLSIRDTENVSTTYRVTATNFVGPRNQTLLHTYGMTLVGEDGAAFGVLAGADLAFLPIFIGAQSQQGTTASFTAIRNNTTGIVTIFEAQGYFWGPRSVLTDGGPQRPPTGLYRT